ncbi:Rossmann-fold NAD(P)-binding domain-containing protein [Belnapia rosea]|uniref:hypothetical protein n=1 Tax=Belnapia rosea TaxID=938405 RepID=UPI00087E1BD0|nr:hypothetical protein [Belnapia rosea]SDB55819.1 hypothetical protein SAMN02927895_02146 [Belnapia rosea]
MKSPRRPIGGGVAKQFAQAAAIQGQVKRERERHQNKVASLSEQRAALLGVADPALRAAKMAKVRHDEIEENQRYKAKIDDLLRRAREVWR